MAEHEINTLFPDTFICYFSVEDISIKRILSAPPHYPFCFQFMLQILSRTTNVSCHTINHWVICRNNINICNHLGYPPANLVGQRVGKLYPIPHTCFTSKEVGMTSILCSFCSIAGNFKGLWNREGKHFPCPTVFLYSLRPLLWNGLIYIF